MSLFSIDGKLTPLKYKPAMEHSPQKAGVYILRLETANGFTTSRTVAFNR